MKLWARILRAVGVAAGGVAVVVGVGAGHAAHAETQSHDDALGDVTILSKAPAGKRAIDIAHVKNRFTSDTLVLSLQTTHLPPGNYSATWTIRDVATGSESSAVLDVQKYGPGTEPYTNLNFFSPPSFDPTCGDRENADWKVAREQSKVLVRIDLAPCLDDVRSVRILSRIQRLKAGAHVDDAWTDGQNPDENDDSFGPTLGRG